MKRILLFILSLLFLATAFQSDKILMSGWYQQFLPNLNGRSITDIFFLDSLTGWSVTNATNQVNDTTYILKTTNGGDNWLIQYRRMQIGGGFPGFYRVHFINQNTGFVCGITGLDKSTNGGANWIKLNTPDNSFHDMSVINEDSIWIVRSESLTGGVFRTTNGGLNWTQQFSGGTENPNKIYMYNSRIGFIKNYNNSSSLKKTTNGGDTWFGITNEGFADMYFVDSLNGWRANDYVKKTTDGGLTWIQQQLPQGINGQTIVWGMRSITKNNKDTLWGSYATVRFPNMSYRGILYRTTNGGNNWDYQIPDTSITIPAMYNKIIFINNKIGWAYSNNSGIHTITGGDTLFYTGVTQTNTEVPNDYKLFQNYPNPFNPKTTIEYEIKRAGFITLVVYDILGKEMMTLVSQQQTPGKYLVDFPGVIFPSGVYFYRLTTDNYSETKRMMLIK